MDMQNRISELKMQLESLKEFQTQPGANVPGVKEQVEISIKGIENAIRVLGKYFYDSADCIYMYVTDFSTDANCNLIKYNAFGFNDNQFCVENGVEYRISNKALDGLVEISKEDFMKLCKEKSEQAIKNFFPL